MSIDIVFSPSSFPAIAGSGCHYNSAVKDCTEESAVLSLFTVVQFPNQDCLSASGDNGTCLAASECFAAGGIASGLCANNFGVCCIFMSTCGLSTNKNCTYFVNSDYPNPTDKTGTCQLTIHKAHADVCQYRLDFVQFTTMGPEPVHHTCSNDQFIISGGTPINPICGENSGNHMYIDAGVGTTTPVTITFITAGGSFPRKWKVRICQIPCSSNYRADDGCLQYFTGITGQIKSFNYDPMSGLQLSNQDYSICIRSERNFCSIQYNACADNGNNRSQSFTLTGNTSGQNEVAGSVSMGCMADWLAIPCLTNNDRTAAANGMCFDRICGGTLTTDSSTTQSPVLSAVRPFRLYFHTNNVEAPNDMGNKGFCLDYIQQPCTNTAY
ncbi:uncharacterized protein LOC142329526 [Lycorma delicatula]|uniref:uncharacterized protein LOC142329526 n=1 Tax=Lycorma delicatula TaxID=130591 RepID=UPI003F50F96D